MEKRLVHDESEFLSFVADQLVEREVADLVSRATLVHALLCSVRFADGSAVPSRIPVSKIPSLVFEWNQYSNSPVSYPCVVLLQWGSTRFGNDTVDLGFVYPSDFESKEESE